MARWKYVCLVALCVVAVAGSHAGPYTPARAKSTSFAVVGYLPEWRYEGANWVTLSRGLSHLILFSAEPLASGGLTGLDRLPRKELQQEARAAATAHGTKLLVCFGGNGRSAGFSPMVRSTAAREQFVANAVRLVGERQYDGIDLNWEYPGYEMGKGYLPDSELQADYAGLHALAVELRAALGPGRVLTLAYYPDGRQEAMFHARGTDAVVDLMHAMAYDAGGEHHSSLELAKDALRKGKKAKLPMSRVTLGLPFYGRNSRTGDWVTYEDIAKKFNPLSLSSDIALNEDDTQTSFNGVVMIMNKVRAALSIGAGGVMIWEAGQDCRLAPVTHGDKTHPRTCPADDLSLLLAIGRTLDAAEYERVPGAALWTKWTPASPPANTIEPGGTREETDL
jgi:GH18 family chitinase